MWIHLNHGDEGMIDCLKRTAQLVNSSIGGSVLIEPQVCDDPYPLSNPIVGSMYVPMSLIYLLYAPYIPLIYASYMPLMYGLPVGI